MIELKLQFVCFLIAYYGLFILINQVHSFDDHHADDTILRKCESNSHKSCSECMLADVNCIWLKDKDIDEANHNRCTLAFKVNISEHNIVGHPSQAILVRDEDFRLPSHEGDEAAIQIRPQELKLYLRHNEILKFQVKYKALHDYPLDIYYLLDQTYSMGKHRESLIKLGDQLANKLSTLTKNYQIAFGYFSDKVAMPYYAMAEKILENPCLVIDDVGDCTPGSNFVHSLNFTNHTGRFIDEVKKFESTANMDDLEGALDALMQIIMCQREFGWRLNTRKMIVMATDGYIHTAGAGLLGGIPKKMPKYHCAMELNKDKLVYDGLQYDYPSIEEIYRKLQEYKVALILAIQEKNNEDNKMYTYYKSLNDLLHEVSYLGMLKPDNPENVINLVVAGYEDVVKKVQLQFKEAPNYLHFTTVVNCGSGSNKSMACYDVKLGQEYVFNFTVQLKEIPSHKTDSFTIEETHIHEHLKIQIEYPEFCECKDDKLEQINDKWHGSYECGLFKCEPGWAGDKCDEKCDRTMGRYKNATYTSATCSNKGDFDETTCKCICDSMYIGNYCEYSQCGANAQNQICSGNGVCDNGVCKCNEDYDGAICDCTTITDTCMVPGQSVMCNSNGNCVCGKCECKAEKKGIKYFGRNCEHCTGCHNCAYNDVLVKHVQGELSESESALYTFDERTQNGSECRVEFSQNTTAHCDLIYTFEINDDKIAISFLKVCQSNSNPYRAGGGILLGVLIGLLIPLVIWKVVVTYKDKREYAKFQSNVDTRTSFEQNNLYVPPVTHYINPTLGKKVTEQENSAF